MKKLMVLVAAMAMVATFAMTAAAGEWNFYGSARVSTFVSDLTVVDGGDISKNFDESLQGNSRIGATVKVSDELTGGFEYGTGVNVRKLYGEWNFGGGSFLVGQTYTPLNFFYSNQVFGGDNDMLAQGGVYGGRNPMLRLKFGDFQIAAVKTSTATGPNFPNTEVNFPAIEAAYTLKMNNLSIDFGAGYQSYELSNGIVTEDVDSWLVTVGGTMNFGAAYLNAGVYVAQNPGNLIAVSVDGDNGWNDGFAGVLNGNTIVDNDAVGFNVVAGIKANDMFSFEAGYAYCVTEYDTASSTNDKVATYYVQSTVTLAPGVFVIPEVGYFDGNEAGQTEILYYGAKWQINF